MIKQFEKKQCIELLTTLEEMHGEIVKLISNGSVQQAAGLLKGCMEAAAVIGSIIEAEESSDSSAYKKLEHYSDVIYSTHNDIINGLPVNERRIEKRLKKSSLDVLNIVDSLPTEQDSITYEEPDIYRQGSPDGEKRDILRWNRMMRDYSRQVDFEKQNELYGIMQGELISAGYPESREFFLQILNAIKRADGFRKMFATRNPFNLNIKIWKLVESEAVDLPEYIEEIPFDRWDQCLTSFLNISPEDNINKYLGIFDSYKERGGTPVLYSRIRMRQKMIRYWIWQHNHNIHAKVCKTIYGRSSLIIQEIDEFNDFINEQADILKKDNEKYKSVIEEAI